jgi:hypothetical protein
MLKFNFRGVCAGCQSHQPDKVPICKRGFVQYHQPFWCSDYNQLPSYVEPPVVKHQCSECGKTLDERNMEQIGPQGTRGPRWVCNRCWNKMTRW